MESLKNNSFYRYKSFLTNNEVLDLKNKIHNNIKKANTKKRNEYLFRQRTVFDSESPIFKSLINNGFISSI